MDHQPIDGSIYKTNTLRIQVHPTERIYTKQKNLLNGDGIGTRKKSYYYSRDGSLPIASMYGISIPTFTIKINHSCR